MLFGVLLGAGEEDLPGEVCRLAALLVLGVEPGHDVLDDNVLLHLGHAPPDDAVAPGAHAHLLLAFGLALLFWLPVGLVQQVLALGAGAHLPAQALLAECVPAAQGDRLRKYQPAEAARKERCRQLTCARL